METFSFNPPINFFEERKWLLTVTSFETTNSVFNITDEYKCFSISTPNYWTPKGVEENNNNLNILLKLRSQIEFDLHVKENE